MKKIFRHPIVSCLLFIVPFFYVSCQKMDDSYRKFVVPGGITYPGKATSPVAHSGKNRVLITWLRGTDPTVVKANVFWNNYSDSIAVDVPQTGDTISVVIDDLPEQQYAFEIVTYNDKGDKSVPQEVLGSSFGDTYQTGLLNRYITQAINYGYDTAWIKWGSVDLASGNIATEISYIDTSGREKVKRFPISDTLSFISGINSTEIKYRTVYLPDSTSIDTFYTAYDAYQILTKIDKKNMTITADSYEPTAQLPNGAPEKAIDDDPNTFWHTDHTGVQPPYPHWLAIDMKQTVSLALVQLTSRPNSIAADFTDFIIQGSQDGQNWSDYGTFKLPDAAGPQDFYLENPPKIRYVRIYMTKGPNYYSHLAELSLYSN